MLFQPSIDRTIGLDVGGGIQYRPALNDNLVLTAGGSIFKPGKGFRQILNGDAVVHPFCRGYGDLLMRPSPTIAISMNRVILFAALVYIAGARRRAVRRVADAGTAGGRSAEGRARRMSTGRASGA